MRVTLRNFSHGTSPHYASRTPHFTLVLHLQLTTLQKAWYGTDNVAEFNYKKVQLH